MRINSNVTRHSARPTETQLSPQPAPQTHTSGARAAARADSFSGPAPVQAQHAHTHTPPEPTPGTAPAPRQERGFFARVGDAFGRVFTGITSAVVGAARNVGEAVQTFGGGLGDLFSGRFGDGLRKLGSSLVKVLQTPVDAVLMAGGSAVSAVQTLLGIEPPGRKLTAEETALLKSVYGDSFDPSRMRIKEGNAGLFTLPNRPFAHGDTVYVPQDWLPMTESLLVHEAAHVWQHQNGGTDYMSEALWAQNFGEGYDYGRALSEGRPWSALNPEQQASVIERAFDAGMFSQPANPNARFIHDGQDYTEQVRAMITELRAGRGAP